MFAARKGEYKGKLKGSHECDFFYTNDHTVIEYRKNDKPIEGLSGIYDNSLIIYLKASSTSSMNFILPEIIEVSI